MTFRPSDLTWQVAAFALCRRGVWLGDVLDGVAGAPSELELWAEWQQYKAALEDAYIVSLAGWQDLGFISHCSGYATSAAWLQDLQPVGASVR